MSIVVSAEWRSIAVASTRQRGFASGECLGVDDLNLLYELLDRFAAVVKQPVGDAPVSG